MSVNFRNGSAKSAGVNGAMANYPAFVAAHGVRTGAVENGNENTSGDSHAPPLNAAPSIAAREKVAARRGATARSIILRPERAKATVPAVTIT